ncbi:Hypothetical protein PMM1927 [Prochlorococcus marinus subsp. pastoris str. CCMP1986]|uniref:Uncharacterized protein n=1 Tax=Prochlorococcus marinus subsp. pastoris (strain CCMP1986 / NIES-2087 / MED4) TaxID=59919 RepID=A8WIE6_PROMP|nr:hypothetical protein PROCH_0155 [Prochlorococcus marinus str. EQPAC1]CAP16432.1 Hypothetical protein PMM1927 [Prochlorococcus marinus subsp. pastoris str. CCMP1986]
MFQSLFSTKYNYFYNIYIVFHIRTSILLLSGLVLGLWTSWPGIVIPNNWKCFKDMIEKSSKE